MGADNVKASMVLSAMSVILLALMGWTGARLVNQVDGLACNVNTLENNQVRIMAHMGLDTHTTSTQAVPPNPGLIPGEKDPLRKSNNSSGYSAGYTAPIFTGKYAPLVGP